jgi:FkbM family methyltransferase
MRLDETLIRIRKLAVLATDWFYLRRFLAHRVAPAIEHAAILRRLPFDFVIDAGANRGQFSLVCRRLRPDAAIVAFEPLPEPAAVYRALFAGDVRVRLHANALGMERTQAAMHVSARDDSSSLLPISSVQTNNYPGSGAVGTHTVAVGPMSDFISEGDFGARNLLKIDVQGYELEVLKSAEALLSRFDWIYVECSYLPLYEGQALAKDVTDFVTARGFSLAGRYNVSYVESSGEPLQGDFLFARA